MNSGSTAVLERLVSMSKAGVGTSVSAADTCIFTTMHFLSVNPNMQKKKKTKKQILILSTTCLKLNPKQPIWGHFIW